MLNGLMKHTFHVKYLSARLALMFFLNCSNDIWQIYLSALKIKHLSSRLNVLWNVKAPKCADKINWPVTFHCPKSLSGVEIMKSAPPSPFHKWTDPLWLGQSFPTRPQSYNHHCSFVCWQTMMMLLLKCSWETGFPMSQLRRVWSVQPGCDEKIFAYTSCITYRTL